MKWFARFSFVIFLLEVALGIAQPGLVSAQNTPMVPMQEVSPDDLQGEFKAVWLDATHLQITFRGPAYLYRHTTDYTSPIYVATADQDSVFQLLLPPYAPTDQHYHAKLLDQYELRKPNGDQVFYFAANRNALPTMAR